MQIPVQNLGFDEVFTYQGERRLIAVRCVRPTKDKGPYFQLGPLPKVIIVRVFPLSTLNK